MISEITVYFYKNKNKTIFKEIHIKYLSEELFFNFDESADNEVKEAKRIKSIFFLFLKRLENETGLSFKELTQRKTIKFKNVEIIDLNDKIDNDDTKFYMNSAIFSLLISIGNIPGTLPLYFMFSGLACQMQNYIEYESEYKNNEKNIKKLSEKYNIKYNKTKTKIRKLIFKTALLLNLISSILSVSNKANEYKGKLYESQIEICNPLDDENIENLTDEDIKSYINEAIDNNQNISNMDKNIIKTIDKYAMDSDYIDYEELYIDLNTLKIYDFDEYIIDGNITVGASYNKPNNLIKMYYNESLSRKTSIQHELIHSTGSFESNFLNEGMTAILQREYYENNENVEGYTRNVNAIRLLCELIGPDIVLEAFNTENDDLLYNELAKIYGDYDYAKNAVNKLDEIEKYVKYCDNESMVYEACKGLTKELSLYIENSDNKDQIKLNYYLNSIIYGNDANEVYYFNTEKNQKLELKLN